MGYEVKVIVGELTSQKYHLDKSLRWISVFGIIDICKTNLSCCSRAAYDPSDLTPAFFIADDGDTSIVKDRYNDPIMAIPLKLFIKAFRAEVKEHPGKMVYRRHQWLKSFVESVNRTPTRDDAVVAFYGH
ncbi:MAG: hypothetical protein JRZ94_05470 [Nitrososphaerota archaeon]|nr:hypothetical protein [Nitrososphaerota archaeon]